jgi:methionyl-tRNA formyltransferase
VRIGWIGFHEEGLLALRALVERGFPVMGAVTLTPVAAGRRSGVGDYQALCRELGVRLFEVDDINGPAGLAALRELDLDLAFVIGWSQLVRAEALALARRGMIGAHASLLPRNRGRAPVNWAIIRGETEAGNTLLWLGDSVDGGDVIGRTEIPITPYDTCATVYERVAESNRDLILGALPSLLAGERPGRPQERSDEPLLPRRRPEDGLVDWAAASARVYDLVRALARPYPGAFSRLDGQTWRIWQCALLPTRDLPAENPPPHAGGGPCPGEVVGPLRSPVAAACGQVVRCGTGQVALLELEGEDGEMLAGPRLSDQPWTGRRWADG